MALGFTDTGSGDFLPIIKYDARAGRILRIDGTGDTKTETDITANFSAVVDMENIETGWIGFPGGRPDFIMRSLDDNIREGFPARPSNDHKEGFRVTVKLEKSIAGDAPIRHFSHNSNLVRNAFDKLHNDYVAGRVQNVGKLPVIKLSDVEKVEFKTPQGKTSNYRPHFSIVQWVNRPADLQAKVADQPAKNGNGATQRPTPPSTGSTVKMPPTQAPAAEEAVMDFG